MAKSGHSTVDIIIFIILKINSKFYLTRKHYIVLSLLKAFTISHESHSLLLS